MKSRKKNEGSIAVNRWKEESARQVQILAKYVTFTFAPIP